MGEKCDDEDLDRSEFPLCIMKVCTYARARPCGRFPGHQASNETAMARLPWTRPNKGIYRGRTNERPCSGEGRVPDDDMFRELITMALYSIRRMLFPKCVLVHEMEPSRCVAARHSVFLQLYRGLPLILQSTGSSAS
jgi:hypothetical protein